MSEINKVDSTLINIIKFYQDSKQVMGGGPCWAPPMFPDQGRLTLTDQQVKQNIKKIEYEENQNKSHLAQKDSTQCCKTLHASFFFDGTNNNNKNDTDDANPPHPTNVAKLYHASSPDIKEAMDKGFYAYYLPGVGTPFPEIKTYEYYSSGLTFATGGLARINWALIQIYNTLYHAVTGDKLTLSKMRTLQLNMNSSESYNPTRILFEQFRTIRNKIIKNKPKFVALKLYIYGFSRGSAEARTFIYWVDKFLTYIYTQAPPLRPLMFPKGTIYGIPVSVEFLGLFDTVAAVGLANVMPMFTGHNGWADGTQQLPKSDLIKNCYHFVAAHEQRQSFAVDSIRTPEGNYPPNTIEVIYPGMHSDIGGGYPPGDQGKALAGHEELISQITLHDMYAAAIDAGAPLALSEDFFSLLPQEQQKKYIFRLMKQSSLKEFKISKLLIDKFNIWREQTLPEITIKQKNNNIKSYIPNRFITDDIESVIECQLILITAWRIGRYASPQDSAMNLTQQDFFKNAPQHADIAVQPYDSEFSKQASNAIAKEYWDVNKKTAEIREKREKEQKKQSDINNWQPSPKHIGPPLFDATNSRGQFWEASLEFKADYEDISRPPPLIDTKHQKVKKVCESMNYYHSDNPYYIPDKKCDSLPEYSFPVSVDIQATILQELGGEIQDYAYLITYQDERNEYLSLKEKSKKLYSTLKSTLVKNDKDSYIGKIVDLLDNHIHDSRAWFMHSESGIREPFSSYFLSRMIYFGEHWNKSMQLISNNGLIYGIKNIEKIYYFYYLPTYGLKILIKETGIDAEINDNERPTPTNNILYQIKKIDNLIQQNKIQETKNALKKHFTEININ